MKPVLLWPKSPTDIAAHLQRKPDDFVVVDTNSYYDFRNLSALRSDTPIFDPFPKSGRHHRDYLNHVNAKHCRFHIVGLAACQDVLRTLKDPSLSRASIEEVLLALGYLGQSGSMRRRALSPLTTFLCRLIGLFLAPVSLAALVNRETTMALAEALVHNRPLSFVAGVMAVLGGLAMVLTHNIWTGGALPVVITIMGWIILAAGLLLLFLPASAIIGLWQLLYSEEHFYVYPAATLALGLYLSYAGFQTLLPAPPRVKR